MRGTCTCSARCDRNAPGATHTWAARRQPAAHRGGSGGRVARAARIRARIATNATRRDRPTLGQPCADTPTAVVADAVATHVRHVYVLGSLRSPRAGSNPYLGRPAPTCCSPWRQQRSHRTNGTHTCPVRCDRDAPGSAHPRAARRRYVACRGGRRGRVARAARVRARLAAIATRRERPIFGPPGANQPLTVAAAAVASHERHVYVPGSLRSRRAGVGPPSGRPAQIRRPPRRRRRSRRTSGTCTCSARCDRDAPETTHTWAAQRRYADCRGDSGGRVARAARVRAQLAAIMTRLVRPALGPPGANQPPAVAAEANATHEPHMYVLGSLRAIRARIGPTPGRLAQIRSPPWRQLRTRSTCSTRTCSAGCDRDAPGATHTWAVRQQPTACMTAGAVALRERHVYVLGSLQSRRAGISPPSGRTAQIRRLTWRASAY